MEGPDERPPRVAPRPHRLRGETSGTGPTHEANGSNDDSPVTRVAPCRGIIEGGMSGRGLSVDVTFGGSRRLRCRELVPAVAALVGCKFCSRGPSRVP